MPKFIVTYVRVVDYLSTKFGRMAMYLIFVMIATLLLDAVTRNVINIPLSWCIEMAQFTMTAYYIVGGPYSMQLDCCTAVFLVFYLCCLLIGAISSTMYAIEYDQRKFSMWNPSMIPIKLIMVFGIALMLLQAISTFFKDLAKARGVELS